jgi:hypothetical protein
MDANRFPHVMTTALEHLTALFEQQAVAGGNLFIKG